MPAYHFTTLRQNGTPSENLGATELRNDSEAVEFGESVIRDLMNGDSEQYSGWVLSVTEDERIVRSIPFADPDLKKN